jgi:hypothetical protein
MQETGPDLKKYAHRLSPGHHSGSEPAGPVPPPGPVDAFGVIPAFRDIPALDAIRTAYPVRNRSGRLAPLAGIRSNRCGFNPGPGTGMGIRL